MGFGQAIASCFRKYATFSGRALRSEYWYFVLLGVIVSIVTRILDVAVFGDASVFNLIIPLVLFLPSLAVGARRLHDRDASAWWLLLVFIPLIGGIVLIVWFCQRGTIGANRFGDDPLPPVAMPAVAARA